MKRFLAITAAALMVAAPSLADAWSVGTATVTPEVSVDQTFTYAFTGTGFSATNQDVRECGSATVTIPANTKAQVLDCPASDSTREVCTIVTEIPDVTTQPAHPDYSVGAAFPQGYAMLRITDANPAGDITLNCGAAGATFSSADGWVQRTVNPEHFDFTVEAPATTDHALVKVKGGPVTLSGLDCTMLGGTTGNLVVLVSECDSDGANCATTGLTVTPIANGTNYSDATPTNALIDSGDWIQFDVTTVTTIPEFLFCTLSGTK